MKGIAALCVFAFSLAPALQAADAAALCQLGRDAMTRGEPEKAAEHFEKAIVLQPDSADYHYQLGNAYGRQAAVAGSMFGAVSMGKKAKGEWERAVQLDPNHMLARFAVLEFDVLAPAMFGGGTAAATQQANEIRKRDAIDGHRAFARIHSAAKELELARKEYIDMLKEQPSSARAHYHYAVYLMLTEKSYTQASDELEAALKLDPAYMPAYHQLGHAAALSGVQFARGEEGLRKYLGHLPKDDEPSHARTYYWLGTIHEKRGNTAQAKASYAASLKINSNQKDVKEAMKRVS